MHHYVLVYVMGMLKCSVFTVPPFKLIKYQQAKRIHFDLKAKICFLKASIMRHMSYDTTRKGTRVIKSHAACCTMKTDQAVVFSHMRRQAPPSCGHVSMEHHRAHENETSFLQPPHTV
uniref:Uncharacterized protein n=1 Tax=Rhipicephalus zambeziensis TaxID=60191 RepID=A0A224YGD8_9ACAR